MAFGDAGGHRPPSIFSTQSPLGRPRTTAGYKSEYQYETIHLATLDYQISSLSTEKSNVEKQINEYLYLNQEKIDPLINELLKKQTYLANLKFRLGILDKDKRDNVEESYKKYQEYQQERSHLDEVFNISEEEKKLLKVQFRKIVLKIHPDKIDEKFNLIASKLFNKMRNSYEMNDLREFEKYVLEIEQANLPLRGIPSGESEIRLKTVSLNVKLNELLESLIELRKSKTYLLIKNEVNIEEFINKKAKILLSEIELLDIEIGEFEQD